MFKRLTRSLITFNMALLALVFAAIFTVTAGLMVLSESRQTNERLDHALKDNFQLHRPPVMMGMISAVADRDGNIDRISAPSQVSDETVRKAIGQALEKGGERGSFSQSPYYFAYAVREGQDGTRIVLFDQSNSRTTLRNTLLILLMVSIVSLFLLFLLSVIFARRTVRPIRETFEKQENFIADASHELKTPLAILSANLSLVRSNPEEAVKTQERWLCAAEEQVGRMDGLVSDMLTLARLDSGQSETAGIEDLSGMLTGCLLTFEAVAFEKEVSVEYQVDDGVFIQGNTEKLTRLIYILLDNAVKHASGGKRVRVCLRRQKNRTELSVTNTSEEISSEVLTHIFDRFYRVDGARARETGGYGLGLAIARSIVEEMHGKISAAWKDSWMIFQVEWRQ